MKTHLRHFFSFSAILAGLVFAFHSPAYGNNGQQTSQEGPAQTASERTSSQTYDARTGEKEILTPLPGPAPRINGPKIYGVRPNKKFLYRIPCQGNRPINFEVTGLPAGLTLDKQNGIITGLSPAEKGEHAMRVTATNHSGEVSRDFKLVVGDKIALTPPTGWNSWGGHMLKITDEIMRKVADVFVEEGLADVGFQYISIDDCWMKMSPEAYFNRSPRKIRQHEGFDYEGLVGEVRDEDGAVIPNKHFPDMKALTDYIHSFGLKAGIYSAPGLTCQRFEGSQYNEARDADQYAEWGFDLLKYDLCGGRSRLERFQANGMDQADFWKPMVKNIRIQDRDIFFNLCQYGQEEPWTWGPELGVQSWRIGWDLNHNVEEYFEAALRIAVDLREYSKPGQWNDPDFMYIDKLSDYRKMAAPVKEIPLDTNERYQYVTLWSVIAAPFFFSANIDEIDEFTIRLLSNADVLNINQDALGHVAKVVKNADDQVIMVKDLADGSKAVAVFNRDKADEATIRVDWELAGLCCDQNVYDVWRQKDLGVHKGGIDVQLSPNGVALFKVGF